MMSMKPLVSVIMAAHNAEQTINESIESVLAQTYNAYELLVISDDKRSYEKFKKNDNRIKFLSTGAVGAGPSIARNLGLSYAQGEFITALDADDVMLPNRLENLIPLAQEFSAATDNTASIDFSTGKILGYLFSVAEPYITPHDVAKLNRPFLPIFKRNIVCNWDSQLRFSEDFMFNMQAVIKAGGLAVHPECLSHYRVHSNSISHSTESHLTADAAYTYLLATLRSKDSLSELSLNWREKLIAVVEAKKMLNLDYTRALKNGDCKNFTDFIYNKA